MTYYAHAPNRPATSTNSEPEVSSRHARRSPTSLPQNAVVLSYILQPVVDQMNRAMREE